jgi:hypothetical protein
MKDRKEKEGETKIKELHCIKKNWRKRINKDENRNKRKNRSTENVERAIKKKGREKDKEQGLIFRITREQGERKEQARK